MRYNSYKSSIMLKIKWVIIAIISFFLYVTIARSEIIECNTEQHIKGGGTRSSEIKLILDKDQVTGIVFTGIESFYRKR